MESIGNKNYLFTLSLLTLLLFNSAQAFCVKKKSQSTQVRAASAPYSAPSPSSPPPGSPPPSSTPPPTQSTPPSSSPPASKSTPSSSSPSPKSTPSSNPSTPQSLSPSPKPSIQMQSTSSSPTPSKKASSPSSVPSFQVQSTQTSAPSTPQKPPSQSTHVPTFKTQSETAQTPPPPVTQQTMMDSPDGEVPTSSSPTGSAPDFRGFGFKISATVNSNVDVKKICQRTDYPPLCLESISPFFNGKTDVMQVLAMAINGSYAQTELAMKFLDKLASKPATPPRLAAALRDCKENFGDALDNLEAAYDAIADNDIGTIQTMLSAALTDYVTCEDGIPGPNPLGLHSKKLNNMASNCLAIAILQKP